MSAQRRTTVKEKAPAPAAGPSATPAKPKLKDKSVAVRGKAIEETRESIVSVRTRAIRQLARDSYSEIQKVNWPDQQTTRNLTIVVIGISFVLGISLGAIDFVLQKLFAVMT